MIEKEVIAYIKLVHGSYNILMMFLFLYQGLLGLKIRKGRKAGIPPFKVIKRHRRTGPFLAVMGVIGFFAGVTLIYLDQGHILKYPLHFFIGSTIAISIIIAFLISRKIKGSESPYRNRHFRLGILILCLYPIQMFLGLGILF